MDTTLPLEDIDALLRRNWFLDTQDVLELLYLADEPSWRWIVQNQRRYPPVIREIISTEAYIPRPRTNTVLRNMSAAEFDEMRKNEDLAALARKEAAWSQYKAAHNLARPQGDMDEHYRATYERILKKRKTLNNHTIVPVSVQLEIRTMENELESARARIEQSDKHWEFDAKYEFLLNGAL